MFEVLSYPLALASTESYLINSHSDICHHPFYINLLALYGKKKLSLLIYSFTHAYIYSYIHSLIYSLCLFIYYVLLNFFFIQWIIIWLLSLFILMIQLSPNWSLEPLQANSCEVFQHVPIILWTFLCFLIHFVLSVSQPRNQEFLHGAWLLFWKHLEIKMWVLRALIAARVSIASRPLWQTEIALYITCIHIPITV